MHKERREELCPAFHRRETPYGPVPPVLNDMENAAGRHEVRDRIRENGTRMVDRYVAEEMDGNDCVERALARE